MKRSQVKAKLALVILNSVELKGYVNINMLDELSEKLLTTVELAGMQPPKRGFNINTNTNPIYCYINEWEPENET